MMGDSRSRCLVCFLPAVCFILLAGCTLGDASKATPALPLGKRLAALSADCRLLAAKEKQNHSGLDEMADLPSVCETLAALVRARAAGSRNPALAARFAAAREKCLSIAAHRGAMFTYRGHPGNPLMYRWVRQDCAAYEQAFEAFGTIK